MKSPIGTIAMPADRQQKDLQQAAQWTIAWLGTMQRSPGPPARMHQALDVLLLLIREIGEEEVLAPSGRMCHRAQESRNSIFDRRASAEPTCLAPVPMTHQPSPSHCCGERRIVDPSTGADCRVHDDRFQAFNVAGTFARRHAPERNSASPTLTDAATDRIIVL